MDSISQLKLEQIPVSSSAGQALALQSWWAAQGGFCPCPPPLQNPSEWLPVPQGCGVTRAQNCCGSKCVPRLCPDSRAGLLFVACLITVTSFGDVLWPWCEGRFTAECLFCRVQGGQDRSVSDSRIFLAPVSLTCPCWHEPGRGERRGVPELNEDTRWNGLCALTASVPAGSCCPPCQQPLWVQCSPIAAAPAHPHTEELPEGDLGEKAAQLLLRTFSPCRSDCFPEETANITWIRWSCHYLVFQLPNSFWLYPFTAAHKAAPKSLRLDGLLCINN